MPGLFAVNNKFVNLFLFKNGDRYIVFDGGGDDEATLRALDDFGIDARDVAAVFLTHTDYDHVAAVEVQCIFTPGHTPGSACYLVNGKFLFTGDNLKLKDGKAVLFNDVFNMDNDAQKQSLRKLSALTGIETVFTMHTGYTNDFKAAFAEWGP